MTSGEPQLEGPQTANDFGFASGIGVGDKVFPQRDWDEFLM